MKANKDFKVPGTAHTSAALVHNAMAERAVLAVMLNFDDAYFDTLDTVDTGSFYDLANQQLYTAVKAVAETGGKPTLISVSSYLAAHPELEVPEGYIYDIAAAAATNVDFSQNCDILRDLQIRRELWQVGQRLAATGTTQEGDAVEMTAAAIEALQAVTDLKTAKTQNMRSLMADATNVMNDNLAGHLHVGAPTGFKLFDKQGGLLRGRIYVIAAESGVGKTSLALDMAVNAAREGHPVAFYSCEMTGVELGFRAIAAKTGISARRIEQEPLTPDELTLCDRAVTELANIPFYVDDTATSSINFIISSVRQLARRHHIEAAFIDYLQILPNNGRRRDQNEEQYFGEITRHLKNLARELGICIVELSQLSRDGDNHAPDLRRVRGSGQIVDAADVVATIYRPEVYAKTYTGEWCNVDPTGTALVEIKKGRGIDHRAAIVGFSGSTTHFYDLDHVPLLPRLTGTTGTTEKKQSSGSSFDDLLNEIS